NATPDFTHPPAVVNGASELFVDLFGERGRHTRSAVGVASLPMDWAVEIDAIVEIS
ncbi:MAG: RidA family protein, partial [Pseudomonadota bacterium]|nr:RidA family protein [Pseudomonadota bacterium]